MTKRKQQQQQEELASDVEEEGFPVPASGAKRRRSSVRLRRTGKEERATAARPRQVVRAATSAAAAAEGCAESDVSTSEEEDDGEEGIGLEDSNQDASGGAKAGSRRWHGVSVRRWPGGPSYEARVQLQYTAPDTGGSGDHNRLVLSWHSTPEEAARVYDRAMIAMLGRKVAAGSLNYPLSDYEKEEEYQRYGPDLNAYLLRLSEENRRGGRKKHAKWLGAGEVKWQRRLEILEKARAARTANLGQTKTHVEALVAEQRRSDPLWCQQRQPCGVCPACRQPWRTDLGGCTRLAAFQTTGLREVKMVKLLAANPGYVAALRAEKQQQQQQQGSQQEEGSASQREQQQQQRRQQQPTMQSSQRAHAPTEVHPQRMTARQGAAAQLAHQQRAAEPELEWLAEPPKFSAKARDQVRVLQQDARKPLRQQLAWQQSQFAAALERERQLGAPRPIVGADSSTGRSRGRGGNSTAGTGSGTPASTTQAAPAADQAHRVTGGAAEGVDPLLVDPFSWMARAQPPRGSLYNHQDPVELIQLAALCKEGGMEVPLPAELAGELLEEEEGRREEEESMLRRHNRRMAQAEQQQQQMQDIEEGKDDGVAQLAEFEEAAQAEGRTEGEVASTMMCQLCGSAGHGKLGMRGCPVARMALAVPKPHPECPGCAHKKQPGCKLCLGRSTGLVLAQPPVRRAPWVESLAPTTRQLMLAMQELCSAAVADLGVPAAAWRCTPKALLALGLLAEEAAKREVAARFPSALS